MFCFIFTQNKLIYAQIGRLYATEKQADWDSIRIYLSNVSNQSSDKTVYPYTVLLCANVMANQKLSFTAQDRQVQVLIRDKKLALCIRGNPKTSTFANSEDQDEMPLQYLIRVCTVCKGKIDLQTKEYNIFLENYNLTPLDMYNGLSQVYCIEPEGRIHSYTKS